MQSLTRCPSRACRPALGPGLRTVGGQNGKKPVESYHWLPFTTIPGEDRESEQAQLARSPNSGPRPVLRPPGFALPEPFRRPTDPDSPGRIANPSCNRSVMGKVPSAVRLGETESSSFPKLRAMPTRRSAWCDRGQALSGAASIESRMHGRFGLGSGSSRTQVAKRTLFAYAG